MAAMEIISGDGELKESDLEGFINSVKLLECGLSYSVVAIIGPQNSGKSTLLNHLYGTRFLQRDPSTPRWVGMATTRGVWIAKSQKEPFTLVMDLEGTDGKERGQDGTAFEKRSALFALAVAHTLLINIWYHDFGREHASNRPLLRTIFEFVITMPMFSPPRKTTLLFVVRDMSSYDESLETPIKEDVQKIWEEVRKPEGRELTPLSDFFNVEYFPMSSYREKRETFEKEVKQLGQKILSSISHGVDRQQWVVSASRFCSSLKEKWTTIKQNDNLDLPAHKVMVATIRCEEIVKKKLQLFAEEWVAIEKAAETKVVTGLGARISSILSRYLSEYDSESCLHFDQTVRNEKRQYLELEALRRVHPAYAKTLGHLRSEQFQSFKTQLQAVLREGGGFDESAVRICQQSRVVEFDRTSSDAVVEQAGWNDASTVRDDLLRDIENHTLLVRTERLSQVVDECRERLSTKLNRKLRQLFTSPDEITWEGVRRVLSCEGDAAASDLRSAVVGFELDPTTVVQKVNDIKHYARNLVENKFRKKTGSVLELMKQRYILYILEAHERNNKAAQEAAYCKCLKFLSVMAVIRLDEGDDNVERVLVSALLAADGGVQTSQDPLASSTWDGVDFTTLNRVPPEVTLITPAQCNDKWEQFKGHVDPILPRVNLIERIWKEAKHWLPPTWVIVGLAVFGFAGLMLFLRVSNLDVLLIVVSSVGTGIAIVGEGLSIYRNIRDHIERKNSDFDAFRKKHSKLMRGLRRSLKRLNKLMMKTPVPA